MVGEGWTTAKGDSSLFTVKPSVTEPNPGLSGESNELLLRDRCGDCLESDEEGGVIDVDSINEESMTGLRLGDLKLEVIMSSYESLSGWIDLGSAKGICTFDRGKVPVATIFFKSAKVGPKFRASFEMMTVVLGPKMP